ncbi:DNA-binding protein [Bradyrhizobium sp. NAS80.1]|uniref:Lrp/AsnC family transcriptional regulator n=1 Tax=Bradyrhizobium sp. NAS80.1 TaxID=1680159 RepID=UPI0009691E1D|nr:Lrp/AsnC family transcriptional regulator [Bradyrhizobium sp. NAS80.1]OKO77255.1 DNA-binding protein [Bradyrhizobium sp. NAS80.1]
MTATIDAADARILRYLQKDNTRPHREIADKIGLSVAAVARRIQRLREEKVIAADVSVVDQDRVGRPLTLIVEVTIENERLDLLDKMRKRFVECPQVQQCYYITGEVDFVLIMNVRDMDEYTNLTRELFFEGGNVKNFRTFVSMRRIKTGCEVIVSS